MPATVPPINSREEYAEALREVEGYFNDEPKPGTPRGEMFDALTEAIMDYERREWPEFEEIQKRKALAENAKIRHHAYAARLRKSPEWKALIKKYAATARRILPKD